VGDGVIGFAETILIDGVVDGDVLAFGKILRITERAVIKGNVFVGSGELAFEGGQIGGKLSGGAGKANLNGYVGGHVELEVHEITFGDNYEAEHGTKLTLPKNIEKYDLENVPADLEVMVKPHKAFFQSMFFYWSLIALFIAGVLLIGIFKNFSRDYLDFSAKKIGKSFGYGIMFLILVPIAIVILLVLLLTIPVGLIIFAVYLILLYLSHVFAALYAGDYLLSFFQKERNGRMLFVAILIGVFIVSLLPQIPFIGWLFRLAIMSFGMGSLVLFVWSLKHSDGAAGAA
jgi:cytoskeletal protein CcmA (bactofilin family)